MSADLDAIEARRAARRAAAADAKAAQYATDLAELDALEEKHGVEQVKALHVPAFVAGLPTLVVVKSPAGTSEYKRFADCVRNAKGNQQMITAAGEVLARACLVYPDAATQKLMVEAFPNLLNDACNAAASFVQMQTEAEKKG